MLIGVDSFKTHLDMIRWDDFRRWNGGKVGLDGKLSGGEPAFGGRNFINGDFIWGHAEATDAMKNPSPENMQNISVVVPLIAPMQAPQPARQQVSGGRGFLNGKIDAHAICTKIFRSIMAGEFHFPGSGFINVWLAVDPDADFSAVYWAGWSGTVNAFTASDAGAIKAAVGGMKQPFRACILCRYTKNAAGKFTRDPHVAATLLLSLAFIGLDTTCYSFWADATDPDSDGVGPNPLLDWTSFAPNEAPSMWRFSTSYRDADGTPASVDFSLDAVWEDPAALQSKATGFMLVTDKWQPNAAGILRYGFVVYLDQGITAQNIVDMKAHPFPALTDFANHYNLPGGSVVTVGRYLKTPGQVGNSMTRDEAERLSNSDFEIFTVWESSNAAAGGEPAMNDKPPALQHSYKIGIRYFDSAFHAGTEDGRNAFTYCGDVLRQPPHTPVFFCVDFDAADHKDTTPVSTADSQKRIEDYFTLVKTERDSYAQRNPGRYYLIGLYANGEVNRWAYEQGIVSAFWQSVSFGSSGNPLPRRPWYHANRWQFNKDDNLKAVWGYVDGHHIRHSYVEGADPDADWGDGGTWSLVTPLAQELSQLEDREARQLFQNFVVPFAGLLP
jgi:hypothetical protein